jgi:hypothetical protein
LPLTTSAQQRQNHAQNGRNAGADGRHERRSDQRPAEQTRPEQRPFTGLGPLGLPPIGKPVGNVPYWEQKRVPAWERPHTPPWELRQIPGWEQGNVARALLDQQRNRVPVHDRRGSKYYNKPNVVYVVPPYGYFPNSYLPVTPYVETPPPPSEVTVTRSLPPEPRLGALRLEVEPRELLQVFVDGIYLGTPADLGDEIELAAGTRRVELRAPGYRTLVFDAEISFDRSITYRGALERIPPPAGPPLSPRPPVAAPAGNKTMYLIPGCYMGNVSPKDVALPAGCDIKKLTTISP